MCCSCVFVFALLFVCYVLSSVFLYFTLNWTWFGVPKCHVFTFFVGLCVFPIDWVNITWIYMDVHNHIVIFTYIHTYIHTVTIYYIHVVIQYIDIDIHDYICLYIWHIDIQYIYIYIFIHIQLFIFTCIHLCMIYMYVLVVFLSHCWVWWLAQGSCCHNFSKLTG